LGGFLQNRIKKILQKIAKDFVSRDERRSKPWTKEIKNKLCELGKEHGKSLRNKVEVWTSGCEGATYREWLFDLVFVECEGSWEDQIVKSLPLIAEIEWSMDWREVVLDFNKLVVGNAKFKLMVFEAREKQEIECRFNSLKKCATAFRDRKNGTKFLLALYCFEDKKFHFNSFKV
jgi:hypothetical protein